MLTIFHDISHALKRLLATVLSLFAEKDKEKNESVDLPLIFSATRVIVVVLTTVYARSVWNNPDLLTSWSAAILGAFLAVALVLNKKLRMASPEQVMEFVKDMVGQFGAKGGDGGR